MAKQSKYSFRFVLSIGLSNADREDTFSPADWGLSDEEWEAFSPEKQEETKNEELRSWANDYIEYSCEEL